MSAKKLGTRMVDSKIQNAGEECIVERGTIISCGINVTKETERIQNEINKLGPEYPEDGIVRFVLRKRLAQELSRNTMKIQFTEYDVKRIIAEHLQDTLIDLKTSDIKTRIDGNITYYELDVDLDKLKGEYKCS